MDTDCATTFLGGYRHGGESLERGIMPAAVNDTVTDGGPISQTLARGLCALRLIATSQSGLTVREVADYLGVHRSIAYRLLNTLADLRFARKGKDGRYRVAAETLQLCGDAARGPDLTTQTPGAPDAS